MTSGDQEVHSQSYLPHEVLSEIFEYLPYVDRKNASLVSKHWYRVSQDYQFVRHECIYFDHISYLVNKVDILTVFINSSRRYHNIVVKDCELNSPLWLDLFRKYADDIQFLMIDRCDVSERTFVQVVQILRSLRKLELHCNNQLLMSGGLFKGEVDIASLTLMHCDQLELVSNRYLSDRIIHDFFSLCPRIRHLSLKNSNISFHSGLYKRFYPALLVSSLGTDENSSSGTSSPPLYRSETVLTFVNILDSLAAHVATLSSLDLSFTLVNNESLGQLATLQGLRLKHIHLTSCDQVSNEGFVQLFQHQRSLTHVDVSSCSRLTDRSVHTMCHSCTDLCEVRMRNCSGITDLACSELSSRICNLQLLDISHCNQITGEGISTLFSSERNKVRLKCLIFAGLNIVPREFQPVLSHCTELRVLDLSHCFTMASDETLRVIFQFCVKLTELSLVSCEGITDWGLIGLRSQDLTSDLDASVCNGHTPCESSPLGQSSASQSSSPQNQTNDSQSSSSQNENSTSQPSAQNETNHRHPSSQNPSNHRHSSSQNQSNHRQPSPQNQDSSSSPIANFGSRLKMFLGSKAEQEILNDAQRKLSTLHVMRNSACVINSARVDLTETRAMCGLNRTKGLTKLNLYGCNRISDASLIYALCHLPYLQYLNLGDVQQISSEGIQAICLNNFRINNLKLHRCFNLQDVDILSLASSLKTLQHLDVSSCSRLTDSCLASLSLHCVSLKSLNLQKCPGISPAAIDSLAASLSSLHTILSPSVTSVDYAEVEIPPAPALPLSRSGAIRRN